PPRDRGGRDGRRRSQEHGQPRPLLRAADGVRAPACGAAGGPADPRPRGRDGLAVVLGGVRRPHSPRPTLRALAGRSRPISLRRALRPLVMVVGLGVVAYLVYRVGPSTILDAIRTLSWRILIVMCFPYTLTSTLDTAAWRFAFPDRVPPFPKLWTA